jgi:hypothetical protein
MSVPPRARARGYCDGYGFGEKLDEYLVAPSNRECKNRRINPKLSCRGWRCITDRTPTKKGQTIPLLHECLLSSSRAPSVFRHNLKRPSPQQQETPDLQTQLERAKRFGPDFSRVRVRAEGPPPTIQSKLFFGEQRDQEEPVTDAMAKPCHEHACADSQSTANSTPRCRIGREPTPPISGENDALTPS